MQRRKRVMIDALPESAWRCSEADAIVCIDVLLGSTTAVTALAQGRRVFPVPSPVEAIHVERWVGSSIVLTDTFGVVAGAVPFGGPATLALSSERRRPLVHVSPMAELLANTVPQTRVYVACLRNLSATAHHLAARHRRVALLGAGEAGEVCLEDQMAAAWLAQRLRERGFALEGRRTLAEVARWQEQDVSLVGLGRSAERLRAQGRTADVDFVLQHVDDLNLVCAFERGELRVATRHVNRPARGGVAWTLPAPPEGH